jgi:uncharacterized protein (TIGR02246 family)
MKKGTRLICCSILVLLVSVLSCQAGEPAAEIDVVKKTIVDHSKDFDKKDTKAAVSFYADDAVIMGTGAGELYAGKEKITEAFAQFFSSFDTEKREVLYHEVKLNGDVAWTMSSVLFTSTFKDKQSKYHLNVTRVLEKRDGKWLCVSEHFSNLVSE